MRGTQTQTKHGPCDQTASHWAGAGGGGRGGLPLGEENQHDFVWPEDGGLALALRVCKSHFLLSVTEAPILHFPILNLMEIKSKYVKLSMFICSIVHFISSDISISP